MKKVIICVLVILLFGASISYGNISYAKSNKTKEVSQTKEIGEIKLTSIKSDDSSVTLKWQKKKDISGYEIFIAINGGKFKKNIMTKNAQYTIRDLDCLTEYRFKVRAYDNIKKQKRYGRFSKIKTIKTKDTKIDRINIDTGNKELNGSIASVSPYMNVDSNGVVSFDTKNAIEDNVSEYVAEIGQDINSFSAEMQSDPRGARNIKGIKVWGNWCGPKHSGGKTKGVLDAQCKKHDLCYAKKGYYFACSCDRALIKNVTKNFSKMKKKNEKRAANAILIYFYWAPCNPLK